MEGSAGELTLCDLVKASFIRYNILRYCGPKRRTISSSEMRSPSPSSAPSWALPAVIRAATTAIRGGTRGAASTEEEAAEATSAESFLLLCSCFTAGGFSLAAAVPPRSTSV